MSARPSCLLACSGQHSRQVLSFRIPSWGRGLSRGMAQQWSKVLGASSSSRRKQYHKTQNLSVRQHLHRPLEGGPLICSTEDVLKL